MPATTSLRPELLPFSFASIPDLSGDVSYVTFGTIDDALQCLTNLLTFQVSVSWSFTWNHIPPLSPPLGPGPYSESFSSVINLPLFIPNSPGTEGGSQIGWYNNAANGSKRENPAARVLYAGSSDPVVYAFADEIDFHTVGGLDTHLRLTRSAGVTQLALLIFAGIVDTIWFASFNSNNAIASTTFNFMGTTLTIYLRDTQPGGTSYIGPITFNVSVTPTFSAV